MINYTKKINQIKNYGIKTDLNHHIMIKSKKELKMQKKEEISKVTR